MQDPGPRLIGNIYREVCIHINIIIQLGPRAQGPRPKSGLQPRKVGEILPPLAAKYHVQF